MDQDFVVLNFDIIEKLIDVNCVENGVYNYKFLKELFEIYFFQ